MNTAFGLCCALRLGGIMEFVAAFGFVHALGLKGLREVLYFSLSM